MKQTLIILFLLWNLTIGFCQGTNTVLSTSQFESHQRLFLAPLDGWMFHSGNDPSWAEPDINLKDWKKFNPSQLSAKMEDEDGKVEGWFRLRIKLDDSFNDVPLWLSRDLWAATDVYIDGVLVHSFGSINPYEAFNPILKYPISVSLKSGQEYLLAIHFVDYETTFTQREIRLKPENLQSFINLTGPAYVDSVTKNFKQTHIYGTLSIGISFLLFFLFWLLVYLNPQEKIFRLIAILTTLTVLTSIVLFYNTFFDISYTAEKWRFLIAIALQPINFAFSLIILEWVLIKRISWISIAILIATTLTSIVAHLFSISLPFGISFTIMVVYFVYLMYTNWKTISSGKWAVVAALVLPILGATVQINLHKYSIDLFNEYEKMINSISVLIGPVLLLVYISYRFKEILRAVSEESQKVLHVTEEKKKILANQNIILEKQVRERTTELNSSLVHLKSTQAQLIQSEKMASLGELTAGIAHEIQNPLNFVNNFSEVSNELIDEMNEEIENGDLAEAKLIANDIKQNLEKINHHGKRADAIVKGMLQHSRKSSAEKEPTDLNALADEYLRLSYHGLRAKDKGFNSDFKTNFDASHPKANIIPQDIGRVLLNLINNAFYAVNEKAKMGIDGYQPLVTVSTTKVNDLVEIKVADNGNGIPMDVLDKIFQPFFTTKPTGEGTGLGLSMSYDIVTKGHGGELKVNTMEGEGTTFVVILPSTKPEN